MLKNRKRKMQSNTTIFDELQIGDWVLNLHNKKFEQVQGVWDDKVMLDYNDLYEIDDVIPVRLTPELLKYVGFSMYDNDYWISYRLTVGEKTFILEDRLLKEGNYYYDGIIDIQCVHELQHLLALSKMDVAVSLEDFHEKSCDY